MRSLQGHRGQIFFSLNMLFALNFYILDFDKISAIACYLISTLIIWHIGPWTAFYFFSVQVQSIHAGDLQWKSLRPSG